MTRKNFFESPNTVNIADDPTTPRRENALDELAYSAMARAMDELDSLNEGFDGTTAKNDEIAETAARFFAGLVGGSVEKLSPKYPGEPLQVVAVRVSDGVEVYFSYMKLGSSCDKVTVMDSKEVDLYDVFDH